MTQKQLDKFIKWYKESDEFKAIPKEMQVITLAKIIKLAMVTKIIKAKSNGK